MLVGAAPASPETLLHLISQRRSGGLEWRGREDRGEVRLGDGGDRGASGPGCSDGGLAGHAIVLALLAGLTGGRGDGDGRGRPSHRDGVRPVRGLLGRARAPPQLLPARPRGHRRGDLRGLLHLRGDRRARRHRRAARGGGRRPGLPSAASRWHRSTIPSAPGWPAPWRCSIPASRARRPVPDRRGRAADRGRRDGGQREPARPDRPAGRRSRRHDVLGRGRARPVRRRRHASCTGRRSRWRSWASAAG